MASITQKATFPCPIETVWKTVTDYEHYHWRSDIKKTEVLDETHFAEYTKDDYVTTFTITLVKPYERWEFDMENSNMKGHWIGIFTQTDQTTEIEFTEHVEVKKFFLRPFVKHYLMKQQNQFIADLRKALIS